GGHLAAIVNAAVANPIDFCTSDPLDGFMAGPGMTIALILGIVVYVIYILGVSTIYQVVVKMRLWQVDVESALISGIVALDHVRASEAASSAVGEGLADALGTGGAL